MFVGWQAGPASPVEISRLKVLLGVGTDFTAVDLNFYLDRGSRKKVFESFCGSVAVRCF